MSQSQLLVPISDQNVQESTQDYSCLVSLIKDQSKLIKDLQKIIEGLNARLEKFEKDVSKSADQNVDMNVDKEVSILVDCEVVGDGKNDLKRV